MQDLPEHELDAPPWQRVEATLMATSRALRRVFDGRLAAFDLNLTEASLMAYVAEHGPVSQIRLAAAMGMGRSSTGGRVAELEARGLVQRLVAPTDARVWLVSCTPAGVQLVADVAAVDERVRRRLREGLSHGDRTHLAHTLERVRVNAAALLADDDF